MPVPHDAPKGRNIVPYVADLTMPTKVAISSSVNRLTNPKSREGHPSTAGRGSCRDRVTLNRCIPYKLRKTKRNNITDEIALFLRPDHLPPLSFTSSLATLVREARPARRGMQGWPGSSRRTPVGEASSE